VTGGLDVFVSLSDRPTGQDAVADDAADIGSSASSATKALALLDCFRQNSNPMGVTELARRTGLPKSTAFRLLTHLEEIGYVGRDGRRYQRARPTTLVDANGERGGWGSRGWRVQCGPVHVDANAAR